MVCVTDKYYVINYNKNKKAQGSGLRVEAQGRG